MGAQLRPWKVVIAVTFLISLAFQATVEGAIYPPPQESFPTYSLALVQGRTTTAPPINLKAARNEHLLAIFALKDANPQDLKAQITGPAGSGCVINIDDYRLRPVPDNLPDSCFVDGMVPLDQGLVYQENPVHVAIVFTVGAAHPAGTFDYSLVLQSGTAKIEQPLAVKIWSFALPEDLPIPLVTQSYYKEMWFNRYGVTSEALYDTVFPQYLAMMRRYKINGIDGFYPFAANLVLTGKKIDDYTKYVNMLTSILGEYKFRYFRLPYLTGSYLAQHVGTPGNLFQTWAPVYYKAWFSYLEEKGWLDNALVKVWDEPTEAQLPQAAKAYNIIEGVVPELQTEGSGQAPTSDLARIDYWALYYAHYDAQSVADAVSRGQKVWVYFNLHHRIIKPPTHQRIVAWYTYQYKFSGYLLWGINYWNVNPWSTNLTNMDVARAGTFIYPHPTTGMPLPTLRLEALRRGFEDYQYFVLLNAAVKQGKVSPEILNSINQRIAVTVGDLKKTPQASWDDFEKIREDIGELLN